MNSDERNKMLDAYSRAGGDLAGALRAFPVAMWTFKPGPERWSIQEIILHIADSEANGYIRCRRAVAEPGLPVMAYEEERWVAGLHYHEQDPGDALELFNVMRRRSTRLLKSLPPSAWSSTMLHPERGPLTLDDWLGIYTAHTPAHIKQMQATHAAWLDAQKGGAVDAGTSLYSRSGPP
jgi:hypothetical protein